MPFCIPDYFPEPVCGRPCPTLALWPLADLFINSMIVHNSPLGQPVPCQTIFHQLQGILADKTPPLPHSLGYLTALNRDKWAELRKEVELHNSDELSAIDSALFVLCLDDSEPTAPDTFSYIMLHNYGANRCGIECPLIGYIVLTQVNVPFFVLRWFDKSLQLIVTKGGHAAINFEHSWGDGVAVLRMLEELYKDKKHYFESDNPTMEGVVRLNLKLSPSVKDAIEEAKKGVEERCQSLTVNTLQYQKYGKNFIKKSKLSPDAILQLAIQVGYDYAMYVLYCT